MILQKLCEYYQRKVALDSGSIAPPGFEYKEIPFIIVISKDGKFITIEDTREDFGKKKRAKTFLVPATVKRTRGIKANLLWDTGEYALGVGSKEQSSIEQKRQSFLECINAMFGEQTNCEQVKSLLTFLNSSPISQIEEVVSFNENLKKIWDEILTGKENVTFRIDGHPYTLPEELKEFCMPQSIELGDVRCLILGKKCFPEKIHPSIKNVRGAQSSGAALVSFNNSAFNSFGKKQNYNAPVSPEATFQYTTALNSLLGKDSKNKIGIGDTTTVFWAEKKIKLEEDLSAFFAFPPKDDPDSDVRVIQNLYSGVYTGRDKEESETRFYILGLAPNAARLSVRFWIQGTVIELANNIKQHFDDLDIIRSSNDKGHYSLFWLLSALSQENKVSNIPPNIAGDIVQTALTGGIYPATMLQQTLRRIRATQDISRVRAGVLKAYLNRFNRIYQRNEKQILMALDLENNNIGYLLGRLFATLEKIQEDASPGLNATIKDRFFGAASATPITVFPQLIKLSTHHLSKMENKGNKIVRERLLGEIFKLIPPDMPAHLLIEDQARFAIGYYHQRQDFFTKKEKTEKEQN